MRNFTTLAPALALFVFGCSHTPAAAKHDGGGPGLAPSDGGIDSDAYFAPLALEVSGHVIDFQTGQPIAGAATIATAAVTPPPNVSVTGSDFTLTEVPPSSAFFVIAGGPPDHVATYNQPLTITDHALTDVNVATVSAAYLSSLRSAFGVTAQAGSATLLVQAVDGTGKPAASMPAAAIAPPASGARGPFFLDDKLAPVAGAKATSASGWIVWLDVAPGTIKLTAGAGYVVQAPDTPAAADSVSLIRATLTTGTMAPPPPNNVSFTQTVVPIFVSRGCYNCHSGNGSGRRLGDLVLDGAPMKIWTALVQTISPNFGVTRVNLTQPAKSLLLTMPSYENPPDAHPVVVFTSSADPDYQKILAWIVEGAKLD